MRRALKAAFPLTLPVLAGYLVLGLGYGVLMNQAGYGPGWVLLFSGGVYAGAMQYVAIDLLASGAGVLESAVMTLLVNARHVLYGLGMAARYRDAGAWKPYLAFSLTDETYALLSLRQAPEGVDARRFDVAVSALNQAYWLLGSLLGSLMGRLLPFDFRGIEFSMTALFVVMLVEQWRKRAARPGVLTGLAVSLACLLAVGPQRFTLPAMLLICGALLLLRGRLEGRAAP